MRVVFRADASHAIGFGHVARTRALVEQAEALGHEAVVMFGSEWTASDVVAAKADAVVIDGHAIAEHLMPQLSGTHTVLLDDMGEVPHACGVVVNHNINAVDFAYPTAQRALLGRRYLMLRKDVRDHRRGGCQPQRRARLRLVISFGGSDPVNATARALRLLPDRALDLSVVIGPAYRDCEEFRTAIEIATRQGHAVDVHRAPADPGALFVRADAAICSAGGTLGELAFLGCPALAYAIVRDQLAPAHHQARAGLIAGGRSWLDTDDDTLRSDIRAFVDNDEARATIRTLALATADADGARRIIEEGLAA